MKRLFISLLSIILLISLVSCGNVSTKVTTHEAQRKSSGQGREIVPVTQETTEPVTTEEPHYDKLYKTILVDPGHGFVDGGTSSEYLNGLNEKDINLSVALKLKQFLEYYGFDVILSHNGETFPKSSVDDGNQIYNTIERTAYVNQLDIDLFISVHCNAAANENASGCKVYYYMNNDIPNNIVEKYSKSVADSIYEMLPDDGYPEIISMDYSSSYYVLRNCKVSSILIEMGFVTNASDAAKLIDEYWQYTMADAMAKGILKLYN